MPSVRFSPKEKQLIASTDTCRLATIDNSGWPHNVTVSYVYSKRLFYIPANSNSTKAKNMAREPKATILIDDEDSEAGVTIRCIPTLLWGVEAERWRRLMRDVKNWQNDEDTAVFKLRPLGKASWFLKD